MSKCYKLSNGTLGPYPEGRGLAARSSNRLYTDLKKCKNCKRITFITASGRCVSCMRDQIAAVYMFDSIPDDDESYRPAFNLPDDFEPIPEAHDAVKLLKSGQDLKLEKKVCVDYGHIRLTNDKYRRCYFCETQRNKQEQATLYGDEYYLTRSKCGGCANTTLRNTTDSSCVDCGHVPQTRDGCLSPTSKMMLSNPDMIITRDDARDVDMTVYRTGEKCRRGHVGWRYVSTGNCIECLRATKKS